MNSTEYSPLGKWSCIWAAPHPADHPSLNSLRNCSSISIWPLGGSPRTPLGAQALFWGYDLAPFSVLKPFFGATTALAMAQASAGGAECSRIFSLSSGGLLASGMSLNRDGMLAIFFAQLLGPMHIQ